MLVEAGPLRGENQRLLLARNGHAAMVASCPLSEAKRKTSAPSEYFALCTKDGHIRSAPAFQRLKRFPPGPRLFATNQPYALFWPPRGPKGTVRPGARRP